MIGLVVKVKEDLTSKQFYDLTVLKQVEDHVQPNGIKQAQWEVQCNCGSEPFITLGAYLRSGRIRQCVNCSRKQLSTSLKKYNEYDYSNEFGIGFCHNTMAKFYFDWDDFELIKDYCWREDIKKSGYHALVAWDSKLQRNISFLQVLGLKWHDHQNHNPLDNRRNNLRKASYITNNQNHSLRKNNTSGISGVSLLPNGSWRVRISINHKETTIGCFINKEEAIKARLTAEAKYYGKFAPQRQLFEEYGIFDNKEGDKNV